MKKTMIFVLLLISFSAFSYIKVETPRGEKYTISALPYPCIENQNNMALSYAFTLVCKDLGFALYTGDYECSKVTQARFKVIEGSFKDKVLALITNLFSLCFYEGTCEAEADGDIYKTMPILSKINCE